MTRNLKNAYWIIFLILFPLLGKSQDPKTMGIEAKNENLFLCKNQAHLYEQEIKRLTNGVVIGDWAKFNLKAWMRLPGISSPQHITLLVNGNDLSVKEIGKTGLPLTVNHVAQWDGTAWILTAKWYKGEIYGFIVFNGKLRAYGDFHNADRSWSTCSLEWDGKKWYRNFDGECF